MAIARTEVVMSSTETVMRVREASTVTALETGDMEVLLYWQT